jgi:hypothetical protein
MEGILFTAASAGWHALASAVPATRNILLPIGSGAAPVVGDWAWMGQWIQASYIKPTNTGMSTVTMKFGLPDVSLNPTYDQPWGTFLHVLGAETGVNSAVGFDTGVVTSSLGGVFCYQITAANGTATVKLQDAATNTNPSFADVTNATSGVVDASTTPKSGTIYLGKTATVRQFLRWQLVLGTCTTCTFCIGFIRGLR